MGVEKRHQSFPGGINSSIKLVDPLFLRHPDESALPKSSHRWVNCYLPWLPHGTLPKVAFPPPLRNGQIADAARASWFLRHPSGYSPRDFLKLEYLEIPQQCKRLASYLQDQILLGHPSQSWGIIFSIETKLFYRFNQWLFIPANMHVSPCWIFVDPFGRIPPINKPFLWTVYDICSRSIHWFDVDLAKNPKGILKNKGLHTSVFSLGLHHGWIGPL